jgi:hypothetical protein
MTFNKKDFDRQEYMNAAIWCNENNATIEDKGDYYEVVAIPLPALDEVKAEKIVSLKADRDRLEVEDIEVDGHLYDYDEKARERINNAIIALQASGTSILWTLADNNSVLVTAQDLIAVVSAVAVRSNTLHVAYRDAKAKVNAAMTAEEVNAVELEA